MLVPIALAAILVVALLPSDEDAVRATPRPVSGLERKALRLERQMTERPGDRGLQRAAIDAWLKAGHRRLTDVRVDEEPIPTGVRDDLADALRLWDRHLEQTGGRTDADLAELVAISFMEMAEIGSRDPGRVEELVDGAVRAVHIAAQEKPILFTLSNLSVYSYFNGEYERGDAAAEGAADDAHNRELRTTAIDQLAEYRRRGETFRRLLAEAKAELRESGDELLDDPVKAYVHSVGLNKEDPEDVGPDT